MGASPIKKLRFQALKSACLVDPGDGFAMDNGESKKYDRGVRTPPLPLDPLLPVLLYLNIACIVVNFLSENGRGM